MWLAAWCSVQRFTAMRPFITRTAGFFSVPQGGSSQAAHSLFSIQLLPSINWINNGVWCRGQIIKEIPACASDLLCEPQWGCMTISGPVLLRRLYIQKKLPSIIPFILLITTTNNKKCWAKCNNIIWMFIFIYLSPSASLMQMQNSCFILTSSSVPQISHKDLYIAHVTPHIQTEVIHLKYWYSKM